MREMNTRGSGWIWMEEDLQLSRWFDKLYKPHLLLGKIHASHIFHVACSHRGLNMIIPSYRDYEEKVEQNFKNHFQRTFTTL